MQTTSYDRSLRIGGGFYLKNLFTEEYLSYEDATLRDPLLIRSASPVKMFCFVRPHNLAFQEEGFVGYGVELKLCALNG
ncbi:MAG: hypothetical protein JST59_00860 [Actinobacteria bacterium]|nr:hypothetical protein [Actinomycetota bacterium]